MILISKPIMSKSKKKTIKGAICITCGEQRESCWYGVARQRISRTWPSIEKMRAIQAKFEKWEVKLNGLIVNWL